MPVKRHLGLDDDRSCIIVCEGNEFLWPGYELRKLLHTDGYDYGFLPPRFFNRVLETFADWYQTGGAASLCVNSVMRCVNTQCLRGAVSCKSRPLMSGKLLFCDKRFYG